MHNGNIKCSKNKFLFRPFGEIFEIVEMFRFIQRNWILRYIDLFIKKMKKTYYWDVNIPKDQSHNFLFLLHSNLFCVQCSVSNTVWKQTWQWFLYFFHTSSACNVTYLYQSIILHLQLNYKKRKISLIPSGYQLIMDYENEQRYATL